MALPFATGAKILVIDDDENIRELLIAYLEREGYTVLCASDGTAGIDLALDKNPAAILCDAAMPGMTGSEVLQAVRASATCAGVPFVLMTGNPQYCTGNFTPDALLLKPFHMSEMIALVGRLLAACPR